jgi:hypothetical protein
MPNSSWIERFTSVFTSTTTTTTPAKTVKLSHQMDVAESYTQDTVVNSIIQQLIDRSNVGVVKYGTTLDRDDLDVLDWIEHSKQEAMDFILYLEKLKRVIAAK